MDPGNSKSYSGSGTSVTDMFGGGTGTLTNSPTYSATDGAGSFTFANTSLQYLTFNNNFNSRFSSGVTFQFWCKVPDVSTGRVVFWLPFNTSAAIGFLFSISTGGGIRFYADGVTNQIYVDASSAFVAGNTWVNIAGSCDFATPAMKLYFNGQDVTGFKQDSTLVYNATIFTLSFGKTYPGTTYVNESLGQVAIYSRVLSDAEVKGNFNALRGRYGV